MLITVWGDEALRIDEAHLVLLHDEQLTAGIMQRCRTKHLDEHAVFEEPVERLNVLQ